MSNLKIDLEEYRTPGSKVFTGRDRGITVRKQSGIDDVESKYDTIDIIIPQNIRSINPSFLEEFLTNVVIKLKPEKFHEKFHFINEGKYDIKPDLEEAIESILREQTALAK